MGRYWLGIDIGGTFTDFTLYDTETHHVTGLKVASTPPDFARAVEDGLDRLAAEHGIDLGAIDVVVHGTTIAVNTLIQRTGARLGLLVTEGFRDILEIQRLRLPNPLDLYGNRPEPLIPRARVAEIRERLRADGQVDTALDEATCERGGRAAGRAGRRGARDQLHPRLPRPVPRAPGARPGRGRGARGAGERLARGVAGGARVRAHRARGDDAYVQPKVRRYLEGFEAALTARAVPAVPYVTKSNGGIMPVAAARRQTVATLLSGPGLRRHRGGLRRQPRPASGT